MWRRAGLLAVLVALGAAPVASASIEDETRLAERYAPVVRLVEQVEECGYGEPYAPLDVDLLFGEPTVSLRGPWGRGDLIEVGPTGADLRKGLYEYHLDFPGNALNPRCDYELWADRITTAGRPTVYAHVATDAGVPGRLALQYWFFYAFNDFNNKHEGDWEMIQLVFEAEDAVEALTRDPVEIGYSQHEGAERAAWDDDKLELVDGTHPVVHPAAGSHANYFDEALYLGRTAEQGVGCDDTSSPTVEIRPVVRTIPSDAGAARRSFPWIAYEGRWGELQDAFFNGPTGPNLKRQWTEPIAWAEDWRDRSYAIPAGGLLGTGATDVFCSAVAAGSDALRRAIDDPGRTSVVLAVGLLLALYGITRTRWRPATPLHIGRRRAWGQTLAAAGRMYAEHWSLFVGIALVFIPIMLVVAGLQALLLAAANPGGEEGGALALLALALGALLTLAGLGLVQTATARALVEVDAGREVGPVHAYGLALASFPSLLGALAIAVATVSLLTLSVVLLPVAVWLAGLWALVAQVVALEGATPLAALRRSSELVRGRWMRVVSLSVVAAAIALVLGPLIGALLIFVTSAPFGLLNIVAGVVYAVAIPFIAVTTTYVYFDALVREELEPVAVEPAELPSELGASP